MSKMNLSMYFEYERPGKMDMCIIVRSIMVAANNNAVVCFHIEHIWYDMDEKRVYFEKESRKTGLFDRQISELMTVLKNQCRHAGDGTYELMSRFCEYCDKKEYDYCLGLADIYINRINNYKRERLFWLVISMLCVAMAEALYLITLNIQYY